MTKEHDQKLQRLVLNTLSFILIFVLYASLLPYNMTSSPADGSISGFLSILQLSTISAEPGKWIGHVIFNALIGFMASLYCILPGNRKKWVWIFSGLFMFGLLIEYFQLFIGSRGTSLVDVYANCAGLFIGFIMRVIFGKFTLDALRYYYQFSTLPLKFVRKLYLGFVIAIILFPFDFYITPLQFELAFATKGLPFFENASDDGIGTIALLAAAVLTFPLGVLYRLGARNRKRRASRTRKILVKFGLFFLILEFLQFFEVSGQSSVLSFVFKYVGFCAGFILGKYFDLKFFLELALRIRVLIYGGLLLYIFLALRLKGLSFELPASMAASMDIIAITNFLPFRYYINVGSGEALLSFLLNLVIFIPVGAVYAIRQIANENFNIRSLSHLMGLGLIIAIIFEVLVLIWGLKRPDVTNILISAFAMPIGYYFVIMCLNSISLSFPTKENQASWSV